MKGRAYGDPEDPGTRSARAALAVALSVQLRLFAPFLPHVTEEVWSWWQEGSVHRATWPAAEELACAAGTADRPDTLAVAGDVLGAVRRAKTSAQRSMRARVARLEAWDTPERLEAIEAARRDLVEAARVDDLVLTPVGPGLEARVEVSLAEESG